MAKSLQVLPGKTGLPGIISGITVPDITALLNSYLGSKDLDIIVTGPEKDKSILPNSVTVTGWINTISKENIQPYIEEQVNRPLLADLPKPGKVISRQEIQQIGVTMLTLRNGVTIILKATDFKNDQILYGAFSPGGTSLYDGADFDMASSAAGLISGMGFGTFSPVPKTSKSSKHNTRKALN